MTLPPGFGELAERLRRSTVLIGNGSRGQGSGIILEADGSIITNAHVVRSPNPRVQLWDGSAYDAELKACDRQLDLALVSIAAPGLVPAPFERGHHVRPGDVVVAVGNPFGFLGAVTAGVVRAVGPLRGYGSSEWVQSDLQLAPGNSGGPLANVGGAVVGVNTMIVGRMGLAIPAGAVRRFLALEQSRERIGVAVRPVTIELRGVDSLGLLVLEIAPGSPAESAALMPGDILIGVHGEGLHAIEDFQAALAGRGERVVRVRFLRGNRTETRIANVLLGAKQSRAA